MRLRLALVGLMLLVPHALAGQDSLHRRYGLCSITSESSELWPISGAVAHERSLLLRTIPSPAS